LISLAETVQNTLGELPAIATSLNNSSQPLAPADYSMRIASMLPALSPQGDTNNASTDAAALAAVDTEPEPARVENNPFEQIQNVVDTDILLSQLLKETHRALSAGGNEEQIEDKLRGFLTQVEPDHKDLLSTASEFLRPGLVSIAGIAEEIISHGREGVLRDSDPPRTLRQHIRDLLAEGDDPAPLLQTIDRWTNPGRDQHSSEEIRHTVAEEWARKLALEQLPPGTIHASLVLHVPDSEVDGHSHAAVSLRMHRQVTGADVPADSIPVRTPTRGDDAPSLDVVAPDLPRR
jgi:hypothetical protein